MLSHLFSFVQDIFSPYMWQKVSFIINETTKWSGSWGNVQRNLKQLVFECFSCHLALPDSLTSSNIPLILSSLKKFCWFFPALYIPDCVFLMTSLVNVSLNFQKLISQICQYFLLKKCEKLLQCISFSHLFNKKKFSVFGYKVVKHLTSWPLNELVKLTMLKCLNNRAQNSCLKWSYGIY